MVMITNGSHGDGDTIPEDLEEDCFPPNFKEQLNWSRHQLLGLCGWVFWSEQDRQIEPSLSLVEYNIRHALQKLIQQSWSDFSGCLVQFWAATKTSEGRTKLTTQHQPFALGHTLLWRPIERQHLCEYRMKMCSSEYNNCFYADANSGEQQLGIPGRVFLHKYPEFTPDVKYYSKKEYPQLDDAIQCSIKGSWALPVFEHSNQTCVGVLEMVSLYSPVSDWHEESFLRNMHDIFQEFGLICLDGYTHYEMQCRGDSSKCEDALEELDMVLRSVCETHELLLALTWIPCSACNDLIRGQFMSKALQYVDEDVDEYIDENFEDDDGITEFSRVSKFTHLRKGEVSERALSSPSMLYCPDITQLNIAEYPLVHYACWCGLSGLFTICLQSSYTEKEVYVVEFFLFTSSKGDENILTTLSLILGMMEKNFKTFKFASGQQLGEISSAEVMGFQNGQKLPFVQMIQAPRLSTSPELLKDRGLMFQLGQRQLNSPHQPPLDPSNNGHNIVITKEGKRKRQRENKGTGVRIPISLDAIHKCAKMKMNCKHAADYFKVAKSTFKRACREYGIKRWPPRNIEIGSPCQPSLVENEGQTMELNSDLPSNQAVAGVAHIKPEFQDANMVTIKAKYGIWTLKFQLSFSSKLVEFQQEVAKRLHPQAGTFYAAGYKDEDDDLILIGCDDDLQNCMRTSRSQGNTSTEVLLKLEEQLISPSLFEYVESELKTKSVQKKPKPSPEILKPMVVNQKPRRKKSEVADPMCHSEYIRQFPEGIRNHIVEVKDVQADGNCGFRAIAVLIGRDENDWRAVRNAMLEELESNFSLYEKVLGKKRTEELCHKLNYCGDVPAPEDKWMTMPDMGHIVASAFSVVLVFLSNKQCLTFLPFCAAPHPSSKSALEDSECWMGFVNDNHFVQLYMSPGSPIPPICLNWLRHREPHANGWSASLDCRIEEFRMIIGSGVATRETFDLSD